LTKIIKIHGCSGAGKTTVVRRLMLKHDFTPIPSKGKPEAYVNEGLAREPTFILGSYENTCGGMDTIGTAKEVIDLLERYELKGNVIFEGLLQSTYYGVMGRHSLNYGKDYIYAFLDTPIELCLARIIQRREASGRNNKFNPELTRDKHATIEALRCKLIATSNHTVVDLRHEQDLAKQIEDLLNAG
jgi:cytidylate kinase